jgi:hypothetical protein
MCEVRISALAGVIMMVFVLVGFSNTMAGERIEYRSKHVNFGIGWKPVEVGDKPGHVIALSEAKGVGVRYEGAPGGPYKLEIREMVELYGDGTGTSSGYGKATYLDDSSYFLKWEDINIKDDRAWGTAVYYGGTGRFKGMTGGEKFDCKLLGDRFVCDIDAWIELP